MLFLTRNQLAKIRQIIGKEKGLSVTADKSVANGPLIGSAAPSATFWQFETERVKGPKLQHIELRPRR